MPIRAGLGDIARRWKVAEADAVDKPAFSSAAFFLQSLAQSSACHSSGTVHPFFHHYLSGTSRRGSFVLIFLPPLPLPLSFPFSLDRLSNPFTVLTLSCRCLCPFIAFQDLFALAASVKN